MGYGQQKKFANLCYSHYYFKFLHKYHLKQLFFVDWFLKYLFDDLLKTSGSRPAGALNQ